MSHPHKGIRYGGRSKGTPNKRTLLVEEIAAKYDLDPFDFLMKVVNNDWKALGFSEEKKTIFTPQGIEMEENNIKLDHRIQAAKFASKYLYSEKKPLELDDNKQSITIEIKDYTSTPQQVIGVKKE